MPDNHHSYRSLSVYTPTTYSYINHDCQYRNTVCNILLPFLLHPSRGHNKRFILRRNLLWRFYSNREKRDMESSLHELTSIVSQRNTNYRKFSNRNCTTFHAFFNEEQRRDRNWSWFRPCGGRLIFLKSDKCLWRSTSPDFRGLEVSFSVDLKCFSSMKLLHTNYAIFRSLCIGPSIMQWVGWAR